MRRIQASPWCKGAAVLLLLVFSALAGLFGSFVLRGLLYQGADSWQDTYRFQTLLQERQDDVASLAALALETGQLPQGLYFDEDQWAGAVAQWEAEGKDFWPDSTPDYWAMQQYERSIADLAALLAPDQTWFRFQVCSADGAWVLGGNLAPGERLEEVADTVHYAFFYLGNYWTAEDAVLLDTLYSEEAESAYSESAVPADNRVELAVVCGVARAMDDTVQDDFWALFVDYGEERANFDVHVTGFANFLSLAVLCALFLLWTGGHRRGTEGIVLTWQDRIFLEPYLAVTIAAGVGLLAAAFQSGEYLVRLWEGSVSDASLDELAVRLYTALFVGSAAGLAAVLTLTLRTLAVRIKAGALLRTSALCRFARWLGGLLAQVLRGLPLIWRWVVLFPVYLLANLYLCQWFYWYGRGFTLLVWLALNGAVLLAVCWWALCFRRLRAGGEAIAAGNYSRHIDTARMPHDLKDCGEQLNNISAGLSAAVDEKMKSERFKAELITNVSHDLKTPLTSIINYVNLLKSTDQTDPKAAEYIEVLDRKSQRLKKLTEDLVEASKASTGVLTVNREKIGMGQLIDQALGEWTEKLEERRLTVVPTLPEGETWVYADGRHLWRVVDNLLSNCAKYAMEGTRVYLDLERGKGQVRLSVKNISREPLNIPPERLMERFVRGEESRTTEGSGLGLSIARSLTELQGGEFSLTVDGDLFKAEVTLPQAS